MGLMDAPWLGIMDYLCLLMEIYELGHHDASSISTPVDFREKNLLKLVPKGTIHTLPSRFTIIQKVEQGWLMVELLQGDGGQKVEEASGLTQPAKRAS